MIPIPQIFSKEEVIVFNLAVEGSRWNIIISLSSVEIENKSGWFVGAGPPSMVILAYVELVKHIRPGFIKTFDICDCIETSCNYKLIILNLSAILQHNSILRWKELCDSICLGVGGKLAEGIFGAAGHLELGQSILI